MPDSFEKWWAENRELYEKQFDSGGPYFSPREIAQAAWAYSALAMFCDINMAVDNNLKEALHET